MWSLVEVMMEEEEKFEGRGDEEEEGGDVDLGGGIERGRGRVRVMREMESYRRPGASPE